MTQIFEANASYVASRTLQSSIMFTSAVCFKMKVKSVSYPHAEFVCVLFKSYLSNKKIELNKDYIYFVNTKLVDK